MKVRVSLISLLAALCFAASLLAGQVTVVSLPREPDKKGRPQPPWQIECWLPPKCDYVGGVVVAHPMIKDVAAGEPCRRAAAEAGLGTMVFPAFTYDGKETWRRLDEVFDQWAGEAKHPEIRGAPVLVAGLSASVLSARLVAYERPDRVFGVIHAAGGNLHHHYPQGKTLSGVPFIAMNGEYESCGPEGGIRPHLGFDTQWYLMGDTMLERRKQDPDHLMSLSSSPARGTRPGTTHLRRCSSARPPGTGCRSSGATAPNRPGASPSRPRTAG